MQFAMQNAELGAAKVELRKLRVHTHICESSLRDCDMKADEAKAKAKTDKQLEFIKVRHDDSDDSDDDDSVADDPGDNSETPMILVHDCYGCGRRVCTWKGTDVTHVNDKYAGIRH
jgi:hypothetical protein